MLNHFCKLWLLMCEKLTSKIDFDFAVFWEDMSGRQGSMISPATFREFMSPNYKKLTDFLKSRGINIFAVDTDGYVGELINLFLEIGINMLFPFEQQADNDLIKFRKKFPELRMFGGIDKKILSRDKISIDKELEKISFLIGKGGYIPSIDHNVSPDSSWENFKYYRNRLNEIIDSKKILL